MVAGACGPFCGDPGSVRIVSFSFRGGGNHHDRALRRGPRHKALAQTHRIASGAPGEPVAPTIGVGLKT